MAKTKEKNRIAYMYEIVRILAEAHQHVNLKTIHRKLEEWFEEDLNIRTVKEWVNIINTSFDYNLDVRKGPDGGYLLSNEWKSSITKLATLHLNKEERNALNDAFEIALKSPTYFYSDQLEEAKRKLYLKADLKDHDNEYYVGMRIRNKRMEKIHYGFKEASVNKEYVKLSFTHNYYNIPTQKEEYKPLYIVHDSDETFIIIKNRDGDEFIQNILNVKIFENTHKKFFDSSIKPIENYVNDFTIKIKGEHPLKFKIKSDRGRSIFDLWNYEFEDKKPNSGDVKDVVFYEQYILFEFLYRMNNHIEITYMLPKDKEDWNTRARAVKEIK